MRPSRPRNLAVVDARYGDGPEGGSVRVRVANFGPEIELVVQAEEPVGVLGHPRWIGTGTRGGIDLGCLLNFVQG